MPNPHAELAHLHCQVKALEDKLEAFKETFKKNDLLNRVTALEKAAAQPKG